MALLGLIFSSSSTFSAKIEEYGSGNTFLVNPSDSLAFLLLWYRENISDQTSCWPAKVYQFGYSSQRD
jgi:hypothetical protein